MKRVKLVVYAPPGTGKSTFAAGSDSPLFLTTDGNFEWLGLPDKNNIRLSSWEQAKRVFKDILIGKYPQFQTIVVDLIEDLYVWAEREFCENKGIEHIGDYKTMGAGYYVVRKEFFAEISKLISVDKNIIFLSHEVTVMETNRVGAQIYKHYPSNKISIDKQWDEIEGQVRYFLRAYIKPEEINGKIIKKRYLSIIPKENEYGIARGLDEANTPEDIPLNWKVFAEVIGLNDETKSVSQETKVEVNVAPQPTQRVETPSPVKVDNTVKVEQEAKVEQKSTPTIVKEEVQVEKAIVTPVTDEEIIVVKEQAQVVEVKVNETSKEKTQKEKIEEIKAKLAAMKK